MPNLSDIADATELVPMLREHIIEPYKKNPAEASKRVIIYGPPGTGKTFVAKAIAGELGLGFKKISPSDSAADLKANSQYASLQRLLFFDELEYVNYRPLLMDALRAVPKKVLVIGATNYPWRIQNLLSEGFNNLIFMGAPGPEVRKAIIKHYIGKKAESINFEKVVALTDGYSAGALNYLCEWVVAGGQVSQERFEQAIGAYRQPQLEEWVVEAKANRDRLDPTAFAPLLRWLEGK